MNLQDLAQLTLTLAGDAQAITSTATEAESVSFHAPATNSGDVYIGSANVDSTRFALCLAPGEKGQITVGPNEADDRFIELSTIYWDGSTGDKLNVGYIQIGV